MTNPLSLGDRMKKYEEVNNFKLMPRSVAILRLDGAAFHTLTKRLHLEKPYDANFSSWMTQAALTLADRMQGCKLGYTQSDEITFVLRSDQSEDSSAWFDNRIQKIVSVSSGIVSSTFNRLLCANYVWGLDEIIPVTTFDARIHTVPDLNEALNNLIWRQQDCIKNSISSAAYYEIAKKHGKKTTRKMLDGLNQDQRQELLFKEMGINWANYDPSFKNGITIFKESVEITTENGKAVRRKWVAKAAPIFNSLVGRSWLDEVLNYQRTENVEEAKEI